MGAVPLIQPGPARSLGAFTARDADGVPRGIEVLVDGSGRLRVLIDDVPRFDRQADPETAVQLAGRVLAGDSSAMTAACLETIALALTGAALAAQHEGGRSWVQD